MSERDDLVYVADMLDSISLVQQYASAMTQEQFMRDSRTQDAVIRRIEVIGEAAKQVGLAAVWKTVQEDLPAMGVELSRILEEETN